MFSLPKDFFLPVLEYLTFSEDVLESYLQRDSENNLVVIESNFMGFYAIVQASEKAKPDGNIYFSENWGDGDKLFETIRENIRKVGPILLIENKIGIYLATCNSLIYALIYRALRLVLWHSFNLYFEEKVR